MNRALPLLLSSRENECSCTYKVHSQCAFSKSTPKGELGPHGQIFHRIEWSLCLITKLPTVKMLPATQTVPYCINQCLKLGLSLVITELFMATFHRDGHILFPPGCHLYSSHISLLQQHQVTFCPCWSQSVLQIYVLWLFTILACILRLDQSLPPVIKPHMRFCGRTCVNVSILYQAVTKHAAYMSSDNLPAHVIHWGALRLHNNKTLITSVAFSKQMET